jgi:hypothetical protein
MGDTRWFAAAPKAFALSLTCVLAGCPTGGGGGPSDEATSTADDDDGDAETSADGSGEDGTGDAGSGDGASTGPDVGPPGPLGPTDDQLVPNNTITCADGYPVQINPSFPQPFTGAGSASCTLLTYSNVQPTTPGIAVSANIGVGPVTGPMRFVRMRILEQEGVGPACCSAEEYGDMFTPQANAITTVPLGFFMDSGTDVETEIRYADWIALEVLAPNVPIPGIWTNNGGADVLLPDYLWLPALSTRGPAPTANLRSEGSYSGFVPTFNLSFAPVL